jgi:GMP synthase-like glutamine amidotransferase
MLYIIQNDPEVPPCLIAEELDRLGVAYAVIHPYRGEALPEISATRAIIVMGGAMGANDDEKYGFLGPLKEFMRNLVKGEIPYLGICLGGQLLAAALGAGVTSGAFGEKGTLSVTLTAAGAEDRLFSGIVQEFISFQWHNDSFAIPEGAVKLAYSEACPNQAFRMGSCAWGTQFHPEVDEAIVRDWSSWTKETAARSGEFVAAYREREVEYRGVLRRLMENFVGVAGLRASTGT